MSVIVVEMYTHTTMGAGAAQNLSDLRKVCRSAKKRKTFSKASVKPIVSLRSITFSWLDRKFSCRCMTLFSLCPTSTRLSHLLRLPELLVFMPRRVDSGHRNPVAHTFRSMFYER